MLWIILSLLTALAVSSQDACVKKFFSHLSAYEMASYPLIYSLPAFAATALLVPVPALDAVFYFYFVLSIPLNAVAFMLYFKAIRISPLSLTIPYLAFTPVFMILPGFVFLGEMPSVWGLIGIATTCLGGYILHLDPADPSFSGPFKAVFRETGAWTMLIVAFLFSFAAVIGKKTILHSSPLFFTMSFFTVHNLCVFVFLLATGRVRMATFRKDPAKGIIAGVLLFFHALFHCLAVVLTQAAYMISVKRFSVLFSIVYGGVFFQEKNIPVRLAGGMLMMAGGVLITLKG